VTTRHCLAAPGRDERARDVGPLGLADVATLDDAEAGSREEAVQLVSRVGVQGVVVGWDEGGCIDRTILADGVVLFCLVDVAVCVSDDSLSVRTRCQDPGALAHVHVFFEPLLRAFPPFIRSLSNCGMRLHRPFDQPRRLEQLERLSIS
jgi:hypothetical protein